jgi:hypothetical protein
MKREIIFLSIVLMVGLSVNVFARQPLTFEERKRR